MPNTTVPAAATGLPQIDRRRLLLGLAAASTAAATVTVAQPAPAATLAENPELIRLAEPQANPELVTLFRDLKEAVAEKAAAKDAKEWLADEWRHSWPLAPEEITLPGSGEWDSGREVDLAGRSIIRPGEKNARRLHSLENLTWLAENMASNVDRARTEKKRARALKALAEDTRNLRLAEEYDREIKRIKDASGIRPADARIAAAQQDIYRLSEAILEVPASTIECLIIKAEAVEVWCQTMGIDRQDAVGVVPWPLRFCHDVLNVANRRA